MMKYFKILLIPILIMGCSAAGKLKRADRLVNAAIEMGAVVKRDTVYVERKVYMPKKSIDSTIFFRNIYDTITVTKDRVVTRIKYSKDKHTVYIHTTCPDSTVTIKVPVEVVREIKAGAGWFDMVKLSILVAVVTALLILPIISIRSRRKQEEPKQPL